MGNKGEGELGLMGDGGCKWGAGMLLTWTVKAGMSFGKPAIVDVIVMCGRCGGVDSRVKGVWDAAEGIRW